MVRYVAFCESDPCSTSYEFEVAFLGDFHKMMCLLLEVGSRLLPKSQS